MFKHLLPIEFLSLTCFQLEFCSATKCRLCRWLHLFTVGLVRVLRLVCLRLCASWASNQFAVSRSSTFQIVSAYLSSGLRYIVQDCQWCFNQAIPITINYKSRSYNFIDLATVCVTTEAVMKVVVEMIGCGIGQHYMSVVGLHFTPLWHSTNYRRYVTISTSIQDRHSVRVIDVWVGCGEVAEPIDFSHPMTILGKLLQGGISVIRPHSGRITLLTKWWIYRFTIPSNFCWTTG